MVNHLLKMEKKMNRKEKISAIIKRVKAIVTHLRENQNCVVLDQIKPIIVIEILKDIIRLPHFSKEAIALTNLATFFDNHPRIGGNKFN